MRYIIKEKYVFIYGLIIRKRIDGINIIHKQPILFYFDKKKVNSLFYLRRILVQTTFMAEVR